MRPSRTPFALIAIVCLALLGYGYYLQYVTGLEPCPLCMMQRLAFFGLFVLSLIAALHAPDVPGIRVYAGLALLVSVAGGGIAGRQVWLQHLPADQVPQCGPGLEYMLDAFPLLEALRMILSGSGECAEVDWTFLGLSIAEWSLGWFVALAIIFIYLLVRAGRYARQPTIFK